MFTGIVEETGEVVGFQPGSAGWRLGVAATMAGADIAIGESIAVNGCCLTVTEIDDGRLAFDVLEETRRLTNFDELRAGARVNLERSLAVGARIGGHFVTGHIDCTGRVETLEARGADHHLRVGIPAEFARHVVTKGSIAIDGISLTVAEVAPAAFAVWLIPHTLAVTNLRSRRPGERVNLEFDLLGKHVDRLLQLRTP